MIDHSFDVPGRVFLQPQRAGANACRWVFATFVACAWVCHLTLRLPPVTFLQ